MRPPIIDPIDPFPGPNPQIPPDAAFDALDATLPLALLPLRLEVRFWQGTVPPELRVRIFPDLVHADGHRPELTASEQDLGRAFWRRCWRAGPDPLLLTAPTGPPPPGPAGRDAAFAWLAGRLGPWRAAWIARQMEPLNGELAPRGPVLDGVPLVPPPRFPTLAERAAGGPTYARLLPHRFGLVAWDGGTFTGPWWGAPVAEDVALAPGPVEAGDDLDGRALLDAQGLSWTHDFEEAVDAGMAIRVNYSMLPEKFTRPGGTIPRLLVLGVRAGDQGEQLEALLEAHRYTHGLDFIPQGTPTNATETAAPGICLERPDLGRLRTAELASPTVAKRTAALADGDLFRMAAADAGTLALGLGAGSALGRASNAHLDELRHGEAMARTLWPGTLGHYLDELMQVGLSEPNRSWLRDWSTSYVRGGALLPTLLLGAQPYGLLPVGRIDAPTEPVGRVQHVETVLDRLRPDWDGALAGVPRLDPEAGDAPPGEGERAALVSQILGGVPHPAAFTAQRVDDKRATYATQWNAKLDWAMLGAAVALNADGSDSVVVTLPSSWESNVHQVNSVLWGEWLILRDALLAATTPDEQIEALTSYAGVQAFFRDDVAYTGVRDFYEQWESHTRTSLIEFVAAHATRTEPALRLLDLVPGITRLMGDEDDPSAFFAFHPSRADWSAPLVAEDRTDAGVMALGEWLDGVAAGVRAGVAPSHDFGEPAPLLRQLVHWSAQRAAGGPDGPLLADGLDRLSALTGTTPDPIGALERLVREAVSTSANRLDAWYTAIAAARLEGKRSRAATGLQVGAYGWLEDVKARERRGSQGYVLAPSAAHATTAAILRSGWSAFGGGTESAGLAVDLSSDRIRRARWLIGGVRNGQDLGRLLGARFERRLHEALLDARIEELRQLALDAAGDPAAPTAIVDGLLLARGRAYMEAPLDERDGYTSAEADAGDALAALLVASPPLTGPLDALLGDLDAVADASVAQSVFSLTEGNVPEATAMLSASATGESSFPRLRFADSRRAAMTITHRLLLLVEPGQRGSWPGASTSGRALAAPALEAWLERLLGNPARYALRVRFEDPVTAAQAAPAVARTLADVGLSALDVALLGPAGEQTGLGRLGRVLAAWAEGLRPPGLDPSATLVLETGVGAPSLDDLAVTGRALRALVAEARDLDARDLAPPGATDATSGLDAAELEARLADVRSELEAGRDGLAAARSAVLADATASPALRAAMLALTGFDLPGAVPVGADPAALAAQGETLLAAVDGRLADLDARVAEEAAGWPELDVLGRYRALRDRFTLLVGRELPLAPQFTAADGDGLDASFARPRLASPAAATGWLAAAGRVDPGARRLRVAADLAEALGTETSVDFALAQLPDHPEEGWAAVSRPVKDQHARLCLLATGAAPRFAAGAAAGLVLGTWTEAIPHGKRTAALGVHYESPSARAPQAILLCSAEEETGFSFELVCDTLVGTLDLAGIRMVGPQSLGALGQLLPATYLNGAIPAGETT